jgi:hypothetical protein
MFYWGYAVKEEIIHTSILNGYSLSGRDEKRKCFFDAVVIPVVHWGVGGYPESI